MPVPPKPSDFLPILSSSNTNLDDSITEQNTIAQAKGKDKNKNNKGQKKKKDKQTSQPETKVNSEIDKFDDSEISCIEDCALTTDSNSGSVRCNICMEWFHTQCVGITDLDEIGACVCGTCRPLAKVVNELKSQIDLLLDTTTKFI